MAKKNYYAVKVGFRTGIFKSWAECLACVQGYSGAKFKGFATLEEAEAFMNGSVVINNKSKSVNYLPNKDKEGYDVEHIKSKANVRSSKEYIDPSEISEEFEYIAFIDGSYDKINKIYGSGVIVLKHDLIEHEAFYEAGYDKWDQWNIVGELEATKLALKKAEEIGVKNVAIYHDLKNISLWATGEWKAKNRYTQEYVRFIEEYSKRLNIYFVKVKAHSNESIYNDLADEAAKNAIKRYLSAY
ncbi:MAG: ribonuclease H family protein [Clostridium sp.]|nr:ribonuclease H family protein [Clostridium sp.]